MEFVGQPSLSGASNLLQVPGLSTSDVDDDEGEVIIGIRLSPLPRRKSSVSDDDSEPEPPMCGSRRVSFADAKGLSLVQVKEFETWDVPNLPKYDFSEGEGKDADEYFLTLLNFSLPLSNEELCVKVRDQKVVLETIELLPEATTLKGVVRVLNVSFTKAVYIRATLDTWSSHFDLLAEYIPGSSDGQMDCFSFKLTLVPPFGEQGTKVEFCLRYETPVGTFWANNNNGNYVLLCHRGIKGQRDKPQRENPSTKSCLKPVSQNLAVENISAAAASSQKNISADVSKQAVEVNIVKDEQISPAHSGTSEDDEQKLRAENRRNRSGRGHRKAARMALLRDGFAQRDGSPPLAKQAGEKPVEERSEMHSLAEASSKSNGFQSDHGSAESCSEACVLNETPQARGCTCNKPGKSERNGMADCAILRGGESATHIPDEPVASDEELHNADKSDSVAEGKNLKNIECEPADSVVSDVSQTYSFQCEIAVNPLYHQVFASVGSEKQTLCDRGNPAEGESTQRYCQTETTETSCAVATHAGSKNDRVQENLINMQECLVATLESEEKEHATFSLTANDTSDTLRHRRTSAHEVPKPVSGDTEKHSQTGNILTVDSHESLRPQGRAQEDNVTYTLQTPAIARAKRAELSEPRCSQIDTHLHATLARAEKEEVTTTVETAPPPHRSSFSKSECVSAETGQQTISSKENVTEGLDERNTDNELEKTVTISTPNGTSGEDKPLDALLDPNPNHTGNLAAKEPANSYVSCCEIVDKNDFATHEPSLEAQKETNEAEERNKLSGSREGEAKSSAITEVSAEVAESLTKARLTHGDVFAQFEDEPISVSEKMKHGATEAAVSAEEEFTLAEPAKVGNREVTGTVKEEETSVLTGAVGSESVGLKADDTEAADDDNVGHLEDAGIATAFASKDAKEREGEKADHEPVEKEAEDADVLEEEIGDIVGSKETDFDKKVEYAQATQIETITGGDKPPEGSEIEKSYVEMQEVSTERTNAQKETETENEMELDRSGEDHADVELGDEFKPRGDVVEGKNAERKEETLVAAGGEKTADGDSRAVALEGEEDKVGCSEGRRSITQNEAEDGLSAPVNDACIPAKMHEENVACAARDGYDSPESDSDDEVELYMRCLRAVHAGTRAGKDRDAAFAVGMRPPVGKSKNVSTHMPSISESLDEEQHLSCLRHNSENTEKSDVQPAAAALSGGQEHINGQVSWWKETFSCGNTPKTVLSATSLVIFLVVAYHYDFLACFALYLISVVWLCFQGETRPVKNNKRIG